MDKKFSVKLHPPKSGIWVLFENLISWLRHKYSYKFRSIFDVAFDCQNFLEIMLFKK